MSSSGWLLRDEAVLAAIEVAETLRERSKGLLGREGLDGALLLRPARSVHTLGMKFTIDVALCDKDMVVIRTLCMRPLRMTRPSLKCSSIIEAQSGAFERWNLRPGDRLEIRL